MSKSSNVFFLNSDFFSYNVLVYYSHNPFIHIHFSRLESMNQTNLNNQHFSIPYITCEVVYSQLIHLDISKSTGSNPNQCQIMV